MTVPPRVTFTCMAGIGIGTWRHADVPLPGQTLDVEWNIPEALRWGLSTVPAARSADFVGVVGDTVSARGQIELVADEDDVVTLRIAGGLVLVEIVGLPQHVAGDWLELRGLKVELYPTRI